MNLLHSYRSRLTKYCCLAMLLILLPPTGSAMGSGNDSLSIVSPTETSGATVRHHALYAELLGSGIFYSLNYEYRIKNWIAVRGGGMMTSVGDRSYTNLLLMAMFISSEDGHAFECGAGAVGVRLGESSGSPHFGVAGALAMGYRYQPIEGGLMLRVTYTPLYYKRFSLDDWKTTYWRTMVGLSIGYGF